MLPWKEMRVDLVLESTGKFKEGKEAQRHIQAGARKVIISAPAKGPDTTLLVGINEKEAYRPEIHKIVSMASCTTNCIAPVLKVLDEKFGIESGYMTTVHAYTNDQRLQDSPHKDLRRARAASMSIIPTTTGAAKSIGTIIPALEGKIEGMVLRVPVSNGSIADMVMTLKKDVTIDEVNTALKQASEEELKGVMAYTNEPLVSSDIIGEPYSSIVDGLSTMVIGDRSRNVKVLNLNKVKAEDVMIHRSDLIVMNADMTAENALMQMTQKRIGKVFVCKEETDELVGMVSKTDVLNVQTERQEIAQTLRKSRWSNSKVSGAI